MAKYTPASQPKSLLIRTGDWFFKYRNLSFTLVGIALFLGFSPIALKGDPSIDSWLDLLGVGLAIAGSGFRAWVIGLAYIKRGGIDKQVYADSLVTGGMFSVCRNPLYLGNLLILFGLFMVHNNPWIYCLGGVFFAVAYSTIIAAEEYFLKNKFGTEYETYCENVPRLLPNFSRYNQGRRGMSFNWRRALIKDYSSIYAWVMVILFIDIQQYIFWELGQINLMSLWPYLSAVSVATFLLLAVRFLKKAGLLTE